MPNSSSSTFGFAHESRAGWKAWNSAAVNILDTINGARRAFKLAGRGCLVRHGEDEPRYAMVAEIAARLEPYAEATMLLTAVSEAVERYDPSAANLLEERLSGSDLSISGHDSACNSSGLAPSTAWYWLSTEASRKKGMKH